ncbi:MJ1255/VC2487 family glycosyltransferase [Methanotorris formicicus]|uniref:Glycosyltransferase 28 domain protein n=1 Tax=Methanotorris formicicus Mc-S-70 TaxID=647171 RepID=H1L009_9EURY|nr:MJ1255/VC2487 family glycosyltransferase [Methanotorris formicicus]EHP85307.1 Glycosyltransferase 28 domain protein [Methanotorris formicicus Mc-S-70]
MKILISICGEGFGHTTRCIAVGEELKNQYDIAFIAYGKSKDYIESLGYEVFETYPEIKLTGYEGKFDIKKSIFNKEYNPTKAIKKEMEIIKYYKPDLIISDCKYSTVIAAGFLKKPYYIITNQNYTKTNKKEKFIVYPVMGMLNVINISAEEVLVPDLPLPYTICEYNLKIIDNLEFIGPLVRYKPKNIKDEGYILSVIGGFEYRYRILKHLAEIAVKNDLNVKLVCGSLEVGKQLENYINKLTDDPKNIEVIPFTNNMEKLIKNCSFIVCHGGHSTIMESISFGKPIIVIPDLDHPEQENNAQKVQDLGCGIYISHNEIEKLEFAINEIQNNKIYFENAKKLKKLCKKYNGRDNVKKIISKRLKYKKRSLITRIRQEYLKTINKIRKI